MIAAFTNTQATLTTIGSFGTMIGVAVLVVAKLVGK